jgi:hypothetical protein
VAATSDLQPHVKVTWGSVSAATSYTVYRGLSADTAQMQALGDPVSVTEYLDTTAVVGTVYYYAVKAANSGLISLFSAVASGKMVAGVPLESTVYANPGLTTITVPGGATTMDIALWAGGGNGGSNSRTSWVPVGAPLNAYGGGGASGSVLVVTGITVAPGDVFILELGPAATTTLYKTTYGSATRAYATPGLAGANGSADIPGVGGEPAGTYGASNLVGGTIQLAPGETRVGTAGTAGTTVAAGVGGPRTLYAGEGLGKGGNGIAGGTTNPPPLPGEQGQAKISFA